MKNTIKSITVAPCLHELVAYFVDTIRIITHSIDARHMPLSMCCCRA